MGLAAGRYRRLETDSREPCGWPPAYAGGAAPRPRRWTTGHRPADSDFQSRRRLETDSREPHGWPPAYAGGVVPSPRRWTTGRRPNNSDFQSRRRLETDSREPCGWPPAYLRGRGSTSSTKVDDRPQAQRQ